MARALLGHISSGADQGLVVRDHPVCGQRVAALEAELSELRELHPAVPASLEIELHQLAGHVEPALA